MKSGTLPKKIPKRKKVAKAPKGYDSWFEYELHQKQLKGCDFHTQKVQYTQIKTYCPDFIFYDPKGWTYLIETKGRFRDSAEARKYIDVRNSLDPFTELVFVFYNPKTPMPNARKRKDGTKLTHGDWADKNQFTYYTADDIPELWSKR